jgi:quinol-cytochrome oxidoreductase complex cytochrome b subunit
MEILKRMYSIVLLAYSVLAVLSLQDIHRNTEPDLSSEWAIVVIFFILIYGFLVLTLLKKKTVQ